MEPINIDFRLNGLESAVIFASFNNTMASFNGRKKWSIISLMQNAYLRTQQGEDDPVSETGNFTREGIVYFPYGNPRIVRHSPVLDSARRATRAHRKNNEFYPDSAKIEQALEDSFDYPKSTIYVPANRFSEEGLLVWAFGDEKKSQDYGNFLVDAGVSEFPVHSIGTNYVNSNKSPFVRQIWFSGFKDGVTGFYVSWALDGLNRLRGIRDINNHLLVYNKL